MVALFLCRRLYASGIGTRLGLGYAEGGELLAFGDIGQELFLLLVVSEQYDRIGAEGGRGERQGNSAACP